jgi:hypothetical protein
MSTETKDLRTALAEAFEAADGETAWYLDRRRRRVIAVRHGETSDPELTAAEVDEDEQRFAEVPVLLEAVLHEWIAEFAEERADPAVLACLDERKDSNARFAASLARRQPETVPLWNAWRRRHVLERVDAWLAEVGAA